MKRKLTDEDIIAVYKSGLCQKALAFKYGVSQTTVSLIKRRKIYAEVTKGVMTNAEVEVAEIGESNLLKPEVVAAILRSSGAQKDIAKQFDVSQSAVCRIQGGHTYKSITNGRPVSQVISDPTLGHPHDN